MEELGRGGRLRGDAAGELVVAAYAAESAHGPRLARGLSLADLAHAVALVEGGDLSREDARSLLRGLLELHAIPGEEFPWDPSLGDAFNAREAELERRVGRSAAGWLSAGRPRREAFRVALRLTARARVRELHDALIDQAAALAAHAHALFVHEHLPQPFDLARTMLAQGIAQRRARRRKEARDTLQRALDIFEELGARLWAEKARGELGRIGGRAASRGDLTPAERGIAEVVAAGKTNKEAAAALFLSVHTVEDALKRIYRKLGVRSRTELSRRLNGDS